MKQSVWKINFIFKAKSEKFYPVYLIAVDSFSLAGTINKCYLFC